MIRIVDHTESGRALLLHLLLLPGFSSPCHLCLRCSILLDLLGILRPNLIRNIFTSWIPAQQFSERLVRSARLKNGLRVRIAEEHGALEKSLKPSQQDRGHRHNRQNDALLMGCPLEGGGKRNIVIRRTGQKEEK